MYLTKIFQVWTDAFESYKIQTNLIALLNPLDDTYYFRSVDLESSTIVSLEEFDKCLKLEGKVWELRELKF